MIRRGATTTTDDIEKTAICPLTDSFRHIFGTQVITTHLIRQTGIGVSRNINFRDARHLMHVLAKIIRPQGTVQTDRDRICVTQGIIEGFRELTGQGTA
jgi:hypothetical protein